MPDTFLRRRRSQQSQAVQRRVITGRWLENRQHYVQQLYGDVID
jgi:hypothetical protein